jgi:putative PIN family toxin of toxin-antitoxin system
LIVFDASSLVSAALKEDSVPEQALLRAEETDIFAFSIAVEAEIVDVMCRPKFAGVISSQRRDRILGVIRNSCVWFEPKMKVLDCRDAKDNKYLELALAAGAEIIVSSDEDLLVLNPWRGIRVLRPSAFLAGA